MKVKYLISILTALSMCSLNMYLEEQHKMMWREPATTQTVKVQIELDICANRILDTYRRYFDSQPQCFESPAQQRIRMRLMAFTHIARNITKLDQSLKLDQAAQYYSFIARSICRPVTSEFTMLMIIFLFLKNMRHEIVKIVQDKFSETEPHTPDTWQVLLNWMHVQELLTIKPEKIMNFIASRDVSTLISE